MVVIVSISYIAYKIRNRNGNDEEEINFRTQTRYLPEPQSPSHSTIKVVSTIKRPELRKTSPLPYGMKRTTVLNDNQRTEINKNTNLYKEEYSHSRTYETHRYNTRTNPNTFRNRLEIVNRLKPEEAPKEKFVVSGSGSIALPKYYENFKAIQYYSDDEDEYLYKPSRNYS